MKKLIILRHGEVYKTGAARLNMKGQDQMCNMAEFLLPLVSGQQIKILSSTAPCAQESADILGRILQVTPEFHEKLFSNSATPRDPKAVVKIIDDASDAEVVIVVTHWEYACDIPQFYLNQKMQILIPYPENMECGRGTLIDCEERCFGEIPPLKEAA